jgi:hypothetical protein
MKSAYELQIDTITQRLARLERENRWWKALASTAIAALGLMLLMGAGRNGNTNSGLPPAAGEIQARAFVLVDQHGTPLARLGLLPHGALGLGFYDQGKKTRLLLSVEGDGSSSVSLFSKDGRGSALLTATGNGSTSLRLLDANWKVRASLATWPDGSPFLQFSDRGGKDRVLLGYAELMVTSTGAIVKRPASSLLLLDQDESVIWRAP